MIYGGRKVETQIRWAMVGGGRGSQIGYIHRCAALRDGNFALVAGALDLDPERGRAFGAELGIDDDRCYPTYREMLAAEAAPPDGGGLGHHAKQHALRDHEGGAGSRTSRRLRKAPDLHRRGG